MEVAPDAMYYLALSYHEIGANDWAQEKLIALGQRYPDSKFKAEGHRLLAKLQSQQQTTAVALAGISSNGTSAAQNGVVANSLSRSNGPSPQAAAEPALTPVVALTPVSAALSASSKVSPASPSTLIPQTMLCRLGTWC